jgi:hypothetical protein
MRKIFIGLTEQIEISMLVSCEIVLIYKNSQQPVTIIKFFIWTFYHYNDQTTQTTKQSFNTTDNSLVASYFSSKNNTTDE